MTDAARPKSEQRQRQRVMGFRASPEEQVRIETAARAREESVSEFLRAGALARADDTPQPS